jgi:hypothetical protein
VDATEHPGSLEEGEVASDGLGGDPELIRDGGDGYPSAVGDETGDRVLSLFGVHGPTLLRCGVRTLLDV